MKSEVSDLLANAGAKQCPKCGERAAVQARLPGLDLDGAETADPPSPPAWFCFECGHAEPALH